MERALRLSFIQLSVLVTAIAAVSGRLNATAAEWSVPAERPRLLISRDDVAAIRVRCGFGPLGMSATAPGVVARPGSQREVLEQLQRATRQIMAGTAGPDDFLAPAMLHLVTGKFDQADEYSRYVADSLLTADPRLFGFDALAALDWCWDAIEPEGRAAILRRLPAAPEPLDARVNPLDHLAFDRRLFDLAQAIVLYDPAGKGAEAENIATALSAGREYLEGPFAAFCRQRGAMPTSAGQGVWEEADCVLAVELLRSGLGRNLWPELADSLGRSMEHYFYAETEHPRLNHGFIHDGGSLIPLHPGQVYKGFVPAVPWAIARYARDPIATWYAARSLPRLNQAVPEVDRYTWVRLAYGPLDGPEAARKACPLGRNFGGGWLAMRTGWAPGDTVVLFDAGQPFWRSQQHYDAGQFQIYRKGHLAIDSGDDVTSEAVADKQGRAYREGKPGDWEHYYAASIAHNCVTVADGMNLQRLYGRPWPALGNQRLIERSYDLSAGDIGKTERTTGKLEAFETNSFYSFAATDLTTAYPAGVVESVRRAILTINAGAVLVLDRIEAARTQSLKTWHLQLPAVPRTVEQSDEEQGAVTAPADGEVVGAKQIHGAERNAGVWQLRAGQDWLQVDQGDGRLWVKTLLPGNAVRRLVGGPMRARQIPAGPLAGRTYFGGDATGFEYRLWPASILDAPGAMYELGRPTGLGPQFGVGATWGRMDVYPAQAAQEVTFLHVLIPADQTDEKPPAVRSRADGQIQTVELNLKGQQVQVHVDVRNMTVQQISFRNGSGQLLFEKRLAREVTANLPIPGAGGAIFR